MRVRGRRAAVAGLTGDLKQLYRSIVGRQFDPEQRIERECAFRIERPLCEARICVRTSFDRGEPVALVRTEETVPHVREVHRGELEERESAVFGDIALEALSGSLAILVFADELLAQCVGLGSTRGEAVEQRMRGARAHAEIADAREVPAVLAQRPEGHHEPGVAHVT